MSRSVFYMSISLDGFITGPDDGPDNGLGGERLDELEIHQVPLESPARCGLPGL